MNNWWDEIYLNIHHTEKLTAAKQKPRNYKVEQNVSLVTWILETKCGYIMKYTKN